MMRASPLPHSDNPVDLATQTQRRAADPNHSAWVDASAGSGKTRVLTDRVLRLLLREVQPHQILCLTYTKAAAANMANRLAKELSEWATLSEEKLAERLCTLTGEPAEPEQMILARQLFARILDAPGGLQFLTIHSFCQSLLARFPLEAGVPVGFKVLEGRASQHLLKEAEKHVLAQPDAALNHLLATFDQSGFRDLMDEIIQNRSKLTRALAHHVIVPFSEQNHDEDALNTALFENLPYEDMRNALPALFSGVKTDKDLAQKWAALLETEIQDIDLLIDSVLTKTDLTPRKIPTKSVATAHPEIVTLIQGVQQSCERFLAARREMRTKRTTSAMLTLANHLLGTYRTLKQRSLALDFDDLIERAQHLLHTSGAAWVLYKLDGGLSHVLVDEAQDTNTPQWTILESLTEEFFVGDTARSDRTPSRTIFAVGDYKQSIFSFQGANPDSFIAARERFSERLINVQRSLRKETFSTSFRSAKGVLDAVNHVFEDVDAASGLGGTFPAHRAAKSLPGHVELWPMAIANDEKDDTAWPKPEDGMSRSSPRRRVAEAIAKRLADMKRNEGLREGDVLVLVRQRGAFVAELTRACKALDLAVSGVDRMQLTEQLAVEDILALLQTLLLPEDSLTLASVLKSPLIGMSETRLFELANPRDKKTPLWARVQAEEPEITQWLYALMNRADHVTPYALIAGVLVQPCPAGANGREAILARLGLDALDPLDELLATALLYEQDETPTLQGFLAWLKESDTEIKREMEQAGSAIRIMTVHGSKGLEAPVVILADAASKPRSQGKILFDLEQPDALPLLAPSASEESDFAQERREALKARDRAEYRRLLYVALTRAEHQLIVTGWAKSKPATTEISKRSWYDMVGDGLRTLPSVESVTCTAFSEEQGWAGEFLRYQHLPVEDSPVRQDKPQEAPSREPMPTWCLAPPAPEPNPCRPLMPSKLSEEDEPPVFSPLAEDDGWRFQRGLFVHRLLQTLPLLPEDIRHEMGMTWLLAQGVSPTRAEKLLEEVQRVLTHPEFAVLFGAGSRAEVPVTGLVGERVIAGQIDRLAVSEDMVWLVDFKTNRTRPAEASAIPPRYLRQLAAYRAVLRPLYPNKTIHTILLWTNDATFMTVPDKLLDSHAPLAP